MDFEIELGSIHQWMLWVGVLLKERKPLNLRGLLRIKRVIAALVDFSSFSYPF